MNFIVLAKARYSVRNYKPQPIEPEIINTGIGGRARRPVRLQSSAQRIKIIADLADLERLTNVPHVGSVRQ